MQPTIGRIVLFHERPATDGEMYHGRTRPAIITNVNEDGTTVGLRIFTGNGEPSVWVDESMHIGVPHASDPTPGHWTWPVIEAKAVATAPEPAVEPTPKPAAKPAKSKARR